MKTLPWLAPALLLSCWTGSQACAQSPPPQSSQPAPQRRERWLVTLHGAEVGHELAKAHQAFSKAAGLGFRGLRTDLVWHELEPQRGAWKAKRLRFYAAFVAAARAAKLEPLVVLAGAPGWARELYWKDKPAFFAAWRAFVSRAVGAVRRDTQAYQLWNEANHLIDFVGDADEPRLFREAAALVRRLDPGAKTWVNVLADLLGWERALTRWLKGAGKAIDGIGIDHYPGTWHWRDPSDWAPLKLLLKRVNTPGDAWYGKQPALLETGYSTWSKRANEAAQRRWVARALPALRALARARKADRFRLRHLGLYQLVDARGARPRVEAHFGLLRHDRSEKPAAALVRKLLRSW